MLCFSSSGSLFFCFFVSLFLFFFVSFFLFFFFSFFLFFFRFHVHRYVESLPNIMSVSTGRRAVLRYDSVKRRKVSKGSKTNRTVHLFKTTTKETEAMNVMIQRVKKFCHLEQQLNLPRHFKESEEESRRREEQHNLLPSESLAIDIFHTLSSSDGSLSFVSPDVALLVAQTMVPLRENISKNYYRVYRSKKKSVPMELIVQRVVVGGPQ